MNSICIFLQFLPAYLTHTQTHAVYVLLEIWTCHCDRNKLLTLRDNLYIQNNFHKLFRLTNQNLLLIIDKKSNG